MKYLALAVVGILLALMTGFLLWNRPLTVEGGGPEEAATHEHEQQAALEAAPEANRSKATQRDSIVTTRKSDASANANPGRDDSSPRLRVIVRDMDSKAPVAGATVRLASGSPSSLGSQDASDWATLRSDPEQLATRFGWSAVTDGSGTALVPYPANVDMGDPRRGASSWVIARKDDRYAETQTTLPLQGADEVTLVLEPDLTARVRVVDSTGSPLAEVTVGLTSAARPDGPSQFWAIQARTKAPDGIATLSHLQKLKTRTALIVRCVAPALLGTTAPLDPANPPKEPVTLTVQPSGTLVVRLEGPGNIVDDSVRLRVVGERQPAFAIARFDPATARATYPRVGLGATFTISLERGVVSLAKREVPGPRTPGETIEVVFDLEKDCGHLCARILDPEGKALAETVLRTEIGDRRARIVTTTMKTDAEGRVRIPVPEEFAKVPITWARIALQEQRGALVAKPATPIQWTGGDLDLGDLRCAEAPLIVAGRLVDDDGKPVRGGELGLTQQRGANWKDARNEWLRILTPPQVDAVTQRNEDGSFEIRGTLPKESSPKEPVLLLARHPEFAPQPPIEFKPGQKDVAIVLTRGGEVRAEFLCASQSVVKQLQVTLRPETGNKASELGTSLRPLAEDASRARAGWSRIPEGRYELIVRSQQSGERIHSLAGIAVPRTGTASDPRLGEIDLRPLAQHYTVQIVDASGAKAQVWGSVSFESPEGKRTVQLSDGTATFASGTRGIETTVQAQGLRTKTVHLEPGETKVTQSPGLSVVVRCDEIAELHNRLIGNRQIGALLRRIEKETSKNEWDDWNGGSYSEVGKGGESRFALSEPGAWTFSIIAWGGNDGGNQLHLTTFEPTILSVKDEPGEQVFTLKLKPDAKKKLADWLAANPR